MCIGGWYTEPPLAVASIPVDRCESQVDIQSPPSIHTSKGTQCISTESYWTRYISVSSLPPTSKELHYLRGGYYTDRVPPLNKGEDGHRDRVSTDPHNQLLYISPHPYTQHNFKGGQIYRKSELCWIQQINLIIILALFLNIF